MVLRREIGVNIAINGLSLYISFICSHTWTVCYRIDCTVKNNAPVSIY